jgi:chitinase
MVAVLAEVAAGGGGRGGRCTQTYTVVNNDTCGAIESKTGVSDAQLHALNPAINGDFTSMCPSHLV